MHDAKILAGGVSLVSAVPYRPVRPARVAVDPVVVGFDTEWRTTDKSLISVQLATRAKAGLVSRIFYPGDRRLTPELGAQLVSTFLSDVDHVPVVRRGVRRVHLVAHFAAAELGMFADPLRDLVITQIGKAHHAVLPVLTDDSNIDWHIKVIDLFAFYKFSLADIGAAIGLSKVEMDPAKLEELFMNDRVAFERYAMRDAEIPVVAFERLRTAMLHKWQIDPLFIPSLAALASSIFRRHFLVTKPVPTKSDVAAVPRKLKSGWTTKLVEYSRYAGPTELRLAACRAYWGGRVEAFGRGFVEGPIVERDVVSLYPSAALLQPLPNECTKWTHVTALADVMHMEGFGRFKFTFPRGLAFPSLPVYRDGVDRMLFPSKGESSCTFAEVRAARALGADIEVLDGWGFEAGKVEREHALAEYVKHFLAQKNTAEKDSLEYETAKLLLNALIGKLAEQRKASRVLAVERAARQVGAEGVGKILGNSGALRGMLRGLVGVGGLWIPEWAALIVGRARAVMASIVAKGAFVVSTDAVLVPPDLDLDCDGLSALRTVGSELEQKHEGDALFVARSRMYAILQRADRVRDGAHVLARNARWAVVRVARHGSTESKEEFAETVLACLTAEDDVARVRQKVRLVSAETAVREGRNINDEVVEERKTRFAWDSKRRLHDRDVNPFRYFSKTSPYYTLGKLEGAEHQRAVREGRARVVRRGVVDVDQVLALLRAGHSVRAVARLTGVPKSTVQDLSVARGHTAIDAGWAAARGELDEE